MTNDEAYERARKFIPLAAQTFSKSLRHWPRPIYLKYADGPYVWDVENNSYIDLVAGLCPVILGHGDPDVRIALGNQMLHGFCLSQPSPLEADLAELLSEIIPCAEMSRFMKNGSDVTTAAVRLARHATKRELVAFNAYHGWHEWSAWVKNANGCLTDATKYGAQLGDIRQFIYAADLRDFAALVIDPSDVSIEDLRLMRQCCDQTGALLIFDEIITGFRMSLGGAQAHHGVTPDLACFSKAMANGVPIAALCGKRKYMQQLEDVYVSSTFGGDLLGISAAIATIKKLRDHNVPNRLVAVGQQLMERCPEHVSGPWWRPYMKLDKATLLDRGILCGNRINLMLAHEPIVDEIVKRING